MAMADEQSGTAPQGGEGAAEDTGQPVVAPVQPEAAPKAEPSKAEQPQTPNWDDPSNPYLPLRDKYTGLQGVFKQEQTRRQQLDGENNQLRQQLQALYQERQQVALFANEQRVQQLLEGDPEELQESLKTQLKQQQAQREWEQQYAPTVYQQAYQQAYQESYGLHRQHWENSLTELSEELGLKKDDLEALAKQYDPSDFKGFIKGWGQKVAEGFRDAAMKEIREKELPALKEQVLAAVRSGEPSPDTGGGQVSRDDDSAFLKEYSAGKSSDHKRARALLASL